MNWTDTLTIVEELMESHPDVDPKTIRFTDLQRWVLSIPGFEDPPERCNEKILEAIQMTWIEEID